VIDVPVLLPEPDAVLVPLLPLPPPAPLWVRVEASPRSTPISTPAAVLNWFRSMVGNAAVAVVGVEPPADAPGPSCTVWMFAPPLKVAVVDCVIGAAKASAGRSAVDRPIVRRRRCIAQGSQCPEPFRSKPRAGGATSMG
jgi:hypothetical protein